MPNDEQEEFEFGDDEWDFVPWLDDDEQLMSESQLDPEDCVKFSTRRDFRE